MKKIDGFALLTVLLFLQLVAILGLYAIQMSWLETKQSQSVWHRASARYLAESILNNLEHDTDKISPACFIPVMNSNELMQKPLNWWESRSFCMGRQQFLRYYYAIEFIENDPCAIIQFIPKRISADYYRITLLSMAGDIKIVLQSTLVKPRYETELECKSKIHTVSEGRQMWRELNNISRGN